MENGMIVGGKRTAPEMLILNVKFGKRLMKPFQGITRSGSG
ncbi:hypothetical protein [Dyadobacter fermentans]|nr:hypothetical protein [Dyadobacter fermentans]